MSPERAPLTRPLFTVLRVLFALAILAWVGTNLPWSDELSFRDASGLERFAAGRIEGDWKQDLVRFHPADPAAIDGHWPLGAREPLACGEPILARRRAASDPDGFDWHPGMPRAFRDMAPGGLVLAQVLFLAAILTIVTRWWRLLALARCPTSWWNALRLTFLGLFFNNVIPGATGGDLVKGVLVAKENKGRGAEALVTVLADRVFGLLALAVLALVVILLASEDFGALRTYLLGGLGLCALGAALYASKTFRRRAGLSALVDRIPVGAKLRSLDRAALSYLRQPGPVLIAFLFSCVNHVLVTLGVVTLGRALGVGEGQVSLVRWFVVVPVANLVSAVPLAPGGWGVGELAFGGLFKMIGASPALGVAVSVTFRLSQLALSLLGGAYLLLPGSRSELRDARAE
jgi:hypothetical protein